MKVRAHSSLNSATHCLHLLGTTSACVALQAKSYQVIAEDGTLRNIVELGSMFRLTALATCEV